MDLAKHRRALPYGHRTSVACRKDLSAMCGEMSALVVSQMEKGDSYAPDRDR